MESNITLNQNFTPPTESQIETPTWLKIIFKIYGSGQILVGIIALIIPLFTGFIAGAMGGGKEGFYEGYKIYAFLASGALPAFIFAYGFLKTKRWIIA